MSWAGSSATEGSLGGRRTSTAATGPAARCAGPWWSRRWDRWDNTGRAPRAGWCAPGDPVEQAIKWRYAHGQTAAGFTVQFEKPAGAAAKLHWLVVR